MMYLKISGLISDDSTRKSAVREPQKKQTCLFLYILLIMCKVPYFVRGDTEWNTQLSYSNIYNTTNFVQIKPIQRKPRPNSTYISINPINKYFVNKAKEPDDIRGYDFGNEVNDTYKNDGRYKDKRKLLVGFSHDPYRISVTEEDFLNGVRSSDSPASMKDRGKRGVSHLYNMIQCATGCDPIIYKGYGCYCGFLGTGRYTDPIDRCCKMHDQCYENIYCPFYTVYFQPYYWTCINNEPLCALENNLTRNRLINGCAARLCECDRLLAMCLRRYRCPRSRALCRSSPLRLLQNIIMIP